MVQTNYLDGIENGEQVNEKIFVHSKFFLFYEMFNLCGFFYFRDL